MVTHGPLSFDGVTRTATAATAQRGGGAALRYLASPRRTSSITSARSTRTSPNAIEVYVHRLRPQARFVGKCIVTVRGLGYCLAK